MEILLDSIQENSIYWILGVALMTLAVTVFGMITSRNLPPKPRKLRVRKFALIGLSIFFFCLPIFKPYVSSYSSARSLDELKAENAATVEDLAKIQKEQARQIERLKRDVVELKEDLDRVNLYYSSVVQFLSTLVAALALGIAFRKEENEATENQVE